MTRRVRIGVFFAAASVLGVLLVWASVDLPPFGSYRGPYGYAVIRAVPGERHLTEIVGATTYDVRGFDTLGEELILFTAVAGVVLLLRQRESRESVETEERVRSDAVRTAGSLAVGPAVLVGLWLIAFGYVSPGGGFQGGVAVAAGAVLVWLVASYAAWRPFGSAEALDAPEGIGAGGYAVVGLASLAAGLPFLTTLFGPGRYGTLQSGGSVPLVNWASGIEVTAALLVLFGAFLEQYVVPLGQGRP